MQDQQNNFIVRERAYIGDYSCNIFSSHNARKSFYCSLAGLAVFLLSFVMIPYLLAETHATELASASVDWGSVSLTLDTDVAATTSGSASHGDVLFGSIVPTSRDDGVMSATSGNVGTLKILKKTIAVETTGTYASVWLSTADESTALVHSADSGLSIPATTGTADVPTAFAGTGWGYALTTSPFPSETFYSGTLDRDMTYTTDRSTYANTTWSAVSDINHPAQIWKATTTNLHGFGGENGDPHNTFNIYYGVMIDTDTLAGTYENNLVYTALASSASLDNVSTNISRSKPFGTSGISETIAFDLAESIGSNSITADDVEVFLVRHDDMVAASYDPASLEVPSTTCAVTTFTIDNTKAALTCTIPTISEIADADANSSTEAGRAGRFDFWVRIQKYGLNYLSRVNEGTKEAFAYVGLQSRYKDNSDGNTLKPYVTKMQEMTADICTNTNKWGNTLGLDARVYDYTGEGTALANTMNGSMELGVGTFALTDTRDGRDYLVRHLADGNCWMVQNLDLDLSEFTSDKTKRLTPSDTDVSETWIPDASTNEKINVTYASFLADAGLTSDFQGLMTWLNGHSTQTQQYQNSTQTGAGWNWGVNRTSDDNIGSSHTNNAYAEIPRSYDNTENDTSKVRYIAIDTSNGKTYKIVNISNPNSAEWIEGMTDDNSTITTTTNGLTPDQKLTFPSGTWNFYGSQYIGKYYNWYAATAETGKYSMSSAPSLASSQASSSICPSGWQLPWDYDYTAGQGKSWYNLIIANYGLTTSANAENDSIDTENSMAIRQAPLSLTLSGNYRWNYGDLSYRGSYGYFWSRSASSRNNARTLTFNVAGRVNAQGVNSKLNGFPIRCVAK